MSSPNMPAFPKIYDVIVVGAGLSGLIAARELGRNGYHVLLLESQNRVGGRIESYKTTTGYTLDGSAYFLNGRGNSTHPNPLLLAFPMKTKPILLNDSIIYDEQGAASTLKAFMTKHHLHKFQTEITQQVTAIRSSPAAQALSIADVFGYHTDNVPSAGTGEFIARQFFTAMMTHDAGATLKDISFLELDKSQVYAGNLEWIIGGLEQNILNPITQQINALDNIDIALNTPVHAIHHELNSSKVRIVTHQGKEFLARAALCTVPLGVLKEGNIAFYPSLSSGKQNAIEHLKTGKQIKVILEFEKAFWPKDAPYLYPGSTGIDIWPEYLNLYALSDYQTPTLIGFFYNEHMPHTGLLVDQFIENAIAPLIRIFKDKMSPLKFAHITKDWSSDKNTLGALSFLGSKATSADRQHLQAPDNTLYFAGSHTEDDTLEGAYQSGMRSALQIIAMLREEKRYQSKLFKT